MSSRSRSCAHRDDIRGCGCAVSARPLHDVGPGQAEHGQAERRIASSLRASRRRAAAVRWKSKPSVSTTSTPLRPVEVRRPVPHADVDLRPREAVGGAHAQEAQLEDASGRRPGRLRRRAPSAACRCRAARGRAITSAASGAGGMWRWTWACSKALNSALREATAARSSSVRIGVVTGIPRCVVTCAAGQPLAVDEDAVPPQAPRCRRDRHLGDRPCPAASPTAPPRPCGSGRRRAPSASTPACHADSRAAGT